MSLHWYFLNASEMRELFQKSLLAELDAPLKKGKIDYADILLSQRYMSLWYGCIYVVAEGWRDLGLKDPVVDELMSKPTYLDLLRGYRNDTFHFQGHYFKNRTGKFVAEKGATDWVRKLHMALGDAILREVQSRKRPQP